MKLLPLILVPLCISANASIIHVDIAGTMTGGFSQGESIHIALELDTSMRTRSQLTDNLAFYEWATSEPNWIDASFSIGSASFDASVSTDTVEGLLLTDRELGADRDEWNSYYLGRQLTAITPFVNGHADALLAQFSIGTHLFNGGDFIHGLGKDQEFELYGPDLGNGGISFSYQLVHEFDGNDGFSRENALLLSNFSGGTFNITSAVAKRVPEPSPSLLMSIALVGLALSRGALTMRLRRS